MYNVIEYLEHSAKTKPDKIAVIEEKKTITYKKLNDYCKKGGSYLASQNAFNEVILVFMDKGIDALISFFSTVYAGCCYSLINPELPESRIENILNTTNARFVITNDEYEELAKKYFKKLNIINVKDLKKNKINEKILNQVKEKHIDYDPLYVNFTSGSTGVPKGVTICHRSVIDFIDKFTELFNFKEKDIIANQAPFDFDVSVKDIYPAMKLGATLLIVPKKYFSKSL